MLVGSVDGSYVWLEKVFMWLFVWIMRLFVLMVIGVCQLCVWCVVWILVVYCGKQLLSSDVRFGIVGLCYVRLNMLLVVDVYLWMMVFDLSVILWMVQVVVFVCMLFVECIVCCSVCMVVV